MTNKTKNIKNERLENFDERLHPIFISHGGSGLPRIIHGSKDLPDYRSPHSKRHLDQFSRFTTARIYVQQTDRQTDEQTHTRRQTTYNRRNL